MTETRADIYTRITNRIVADLEEGVRPWHRPWNAEHAAGKITRPLRHNGIPYKGINVIMLWSASVVKGYACPLWLTFKQALELGGNVKKGERGELVVVCRRRIIPAPRPTRRARRPSAKSHSSKVIQCSMPSSAKVRRVGARKERSEMI